MHTFRTAVAACSLAAVCPAQLQFTEVDLGNQIVEVANTSGAPFTPVNWGICVPFFYDLVPAIQVPAGGIVQMHFGAGGTDSSTDWYFPAMPPLQNNDAVMLYRTFGLWDFPSELVDYVDWGGINPSNRTALAVTAGQWDAPTSSALMPAAGESLAYDGTGEAASDWYRDATPTLGAPNDVESVTPVGVGCTGAGGTPTLDTVSAAVDGNLDFSLEIDNGPGGATFILLGGPQIPPFVFFGCPLEVLPVFSVSALLDGSGSILLPVNLASAGGLTVGFQVLVVDINAANGIFTSTRALLMTF